MLRLRITAWLFLLILTVTAGCTAGDEKNILQMARLNPKEIARINVSHAGKTLELTDKRAISLILTPMSEAVPAVDAGNTRMGSLTDGDYVIDVFASPTARPVRFYFNSEKQWLINAKGSQRYHPYKSEALLQPLSGLFKINNYRAVISEKEGLPKYFELNGWLSKNKFYGLQGDQFTVWDTESGTTEILLKDVWTILLSPDHNKLAFTNQKGLNIFDLKNLTSENAVLAGRKPSDSSAIPVCWSPESDTLLYALDHEWHSDFYILDAGTGQLTPFVFKGVKNFLSTPVAWLKNGGILFVVSSAESKEGAREYTSAGYRSDLMEADPEGNFRPITRLEDHQYISFAGLTENEKEALVIIREKNGAERKAALVDLNNGDVEYLPWDGHTVSAGISPDGRFVAATAPLEQNSRGYRLELLDRYTGRIILQFESRDYAAEKKFLWSPDGKKFLYLDKSLEDASKNKLRKVMILPE